MNCKFPFRFPLGSDGVVGYHIALTQRRPPVQIWIGAEHLLGYSRTGQMWAASMHIALFVSIPFPCSVCVFWLPMAYRLRTAPTLCYVHFRPSWPCPGFTSDSLQAKLPCCFRCLLLLHISLFSESSEFETKAHMCAGVRVGVTLTWAQRTGASGWPRGAAVKLPCAHPPVRPADLTAAAAVRSCTMRVPGHRLC